jgi:hypothetical protein
MSFFQKHAKLFTPGEFAKAVVAAIKAHASHPAMLPSVEQALVQFANDTDAILTTAFVHMTPEKVARFMRSTAVRELLQESPHREALEQFQSMDSGMHVSQYKAAWLISEELRYLPDNDVRVCPVLQELFTDTDVRDDIIAAILVNDVPILPQYFSPEYRSVFDELNQIPS